MSWHPSDLVSDADLLAYESRILSAFNVDTWETKRARAIEDWLGPILQTQGFTLERLRTRYEADAVRGWTGGTYADLTDAAKSASEDDIDLAAVFATPANDALFVGSTRQFRGVSVRMHDAVSSVAASVRAYTWQDAWKSVAVTDRTNATPGKSFSGGGALTWRAPSEWTPRILDGSAPLYWAKLTMTATPTGAKVGQIGVIRRSVLCAPVALRTLSLIMREAPTGSGGDGPWLDKAAFYETEADAALQRALQVCGGEFDSDGSDQISPTEAQQTVEQVAAGFRLLRG